jgi:branched-chain amino acid transport system permease protein
MKDFISLTLNGILLAGLYATMSFGLALIYGVMKIINLAHAGFIMLGAYITFTIFTATGLDPFLSLVVVVPLFFGIGMLLYRYVVRRLPQTGSTPAIQSLLLLFGVWLVLQNVAYYIWTGDTRSIMTGYTLKSVDLYGIKLSVPYLMVFATGLIVLVGLQQLLTKTYLGKAIRAVTQNRNAAMLVGINAEQTAAIAFGLGTALAGLAGSLMSVLYSFTPDFGRGFQLKAFGIIVLGGMESFSGVAMGAIVVALVEQYAGLLIPSTFQDAITYSMLVVALVVMPQGLPSLLNKLKKGAVTR